MKSVLLYLVRMAELLQAQVRTVPSDSGISIHTSNNADLQRIRELFGMYYSEAMGQQLSLKLRRHLYTAIYGEKYGFGIMRMESKLR